MECEEYFVEEAPISELDAVPIMLRNNTEEGSWVRGHYPTDDFGGFREQTFEVAIPGEQRLPRDVHDTGRSSSECCTCACVAGAGATLFLDARL